MTESIFGITEPDLAAAIKQWQNGDYKSCFAVIERYAQADHAEAQAILGASYATEHWGLGKDREKAVYWLERATVNGHPTAPLNLALLFDSTNLLVGADTARDDVAERNYKLAFERCKIGAEGGNVALMAALANCYASGWGTAPDQELAKIWRAKAVAAGYKGQP
ncbi:MAG: tetratricopeptide repeat protein [Sulfuricaulis sp.]